MTTRNNDTGPFGAFRDARTALAAAFHARDGIAEGRYCDCSVPLGFALTCAHCRLRVRAQEEAAVRRIVDAHQFVPGQIRGRLCAVCVHPETDPRHHGQPTTGCTSWGTIVRGRHLVVAAPEPTVTADAEARVEALREQYAAVTAQSDGLLRRMLELHQPVLDRNGWWWVCAGRCLVGDGDPDDWPCRTAELALAGTEPTGRP